MVNEVVCARNVGRTFGMFSITLLARTGMVSACSDKIQNKKMHRAGETVCVARAVFMRILCWVLFPMDFAFSGE